MQKIYAIVLGLSLILTTVIIQAEANGLPNAKARAIQNGISIDTTTAGVPNTDIDCIGGIKKDAGAEHIYCYLVADGVPTPDYKTNHIALQAGSSVPCPPSAGFTSDYECFGTTFDGSYFTAGHWRFVVEFYDDGSTAVAYTNSQLIDLAGVDFRNHSFMILPEAALGAVAVLGSIFAAFIGYNYMRK